MKTLREKAVLVDLNVCQLGLTKKDNIITNTILSNHHADKDAGRFNKSLFNKNSLKGIRAAISQLRTYHKDKTLSWSKSGRLLAAKKINEYTAGINKRIAEVEDNVEEFISNYEKHKQDAKDALQGLYDESDYIHVDELRNKFKIEHSIFPIPSGDDFRINANNEIIEELKAGIKKKINDSQNKALKSAWERLYRDLYKYNTTLSDPEKRFKNSLVNNLNITCDVLRDLNIFYDNDLTDILWLKHTTLNFEPDELRTNKADNNLTNRQEAVTNSKQMLDIILAKFPEFVELNEIIHKSNKINFTPKQVRQEPIQIESTGSFFDSHNFEAA